MAEKIAFIPNELPILPVRDTVLFPGAVMPLTVGRESSLALLESLDGEKLLGVVAQLDPRIEDPLGTDLHTVGTRTVVAHPKPNATGRYPVHPTSPPGSECHSRRDGLHQQSPDFGDLRSPWHNSPSSNTPAAWSARAP